LPSWVETISGVSPRYPFGTFWPWDSLDKALVAKARSNRAFDEDSDDEIEDDIINALIAKCKVCERGN